ATWSSLNTGRNGDRITLGRQWTMSIDPIDPDIIYTNTGYGGTNGAWKSTNGGADWDPLWPPPDGPLAGLAEYNVQCRVVSGPFDAVTVLRPCEAVSNTPQARTESCFVESSDGGAHWRVVEGQAEWAGGEGSSVYFLDSSRTWLFASQSNGLWRSSDAGA